MEIIEGPAVVTLREVPYAGIRTTTGFRGMLAERDRLLTELYGWLGDRPSGPAFLHLHVIDMTGPMDLEVGVTGEFDGYTGRVAPATRPAGRYARLVHVNHSMRANKHLLQWARDEGLELDRHDVATGDAFACRYEELLTDPRTQPRKTLWQVGIAIRLRG